MNDVLERAADLAAFESWRARGEATGWCRNPIRLVGASHRVATATGEVIGTFASEDLPDHVLLKACGHRRATRCLTCSATYQADAFQLVATGLRGGKGIPETVAYHPFCFATLTAPSFGTVHSTREADGRARPCRPETVTACVHGCLQVCPVVHPHDDPIVGQPICAKCFDYNGVVIWNAHAGELWRRTTIAIRRALAQLARMPATALRQHVRVSFAKVVEYQRRGVIHIHAVIRLDSADDSAEAPSAPFDIGLLTAAIRKAVTQSTVPFPASSGLARNGRWGTQLDLHPIGLNGAVPGVVAAYLAKYATKSTDPAGLLDRPIIQGDLERLDDQLTPHLAQLVRTAWDLGGRLELKDLRLRSWAHTLGFRGHWLTKSRAYSTTFAALRAARHDWQTNRHQSTPSSDETVAIGAWKFAGRGWTTVGDAWLAETAAVATADTRRIVAAERRAEREKRHEQP
jgi:hypothetical protein